MPAKTTQATATKQPEPRSREAEAALANRISYGLLALLVGSVALSLYSVPFLLVRILAVLVSLGGMGLAVLQFRTEEKSGRNFNGALAGTMLCAAVIVLTAIGPYLPDPGTFVARTRVRRSVNQATKRLPHSAESVTQPTERMAQPTQNVPRPTPSVQQPTQSDSPTTQRTPQPTQSLPQTTKSISQATPSVANAASEETEPQTTPATTNNPVEKPQIPANVPKVIPFPCRKSFKLEAGPSDEWVDASTSAILQDEVAVCVASAAIEPLKLTRAGNPISSPTENLIIHLQAMLIGTAHKVELASWGNSNFGDAHHRPLLKDNSNYVYQLRMMDAGTQIAEHERSKSLYPKLYADDFLIYELPRPDVDFFHLELPASAFGGMGTLRFQIPKSMIEGVKESQPKR